MRLQATLLGLGLLACSAQAPLHGGAPGDAAAAPRLLAPGILSTRRGEYSPTLDVVRGELIFMRRTPGRFDYTLYVSRKDGDSWLPPKPLPISGQHRDGGPYLSREGNELVFDSSRPVEGLELDSINLWRSTRGPEGWTQPTLLRRASENPPQPSGSNPKDAKAGADEFGPSFDSNGNVYFYSFRAPYRGGRHYVIRPSGSVELDESLPDPSAQTFVCYATFSADGKTAVLEGRAPGRRDTDLFVTRRSAAGAWSEPLSIAAVNTTAGEGTPYLTPDGNQLLFASSRPTNDPRCSTSNLWVIATSALPTE